ncbi:long-chain fatty acid--CoA ligase [Cupriavidus pauculus]|uniref:acyl-CoA synthetase n=1 Tax=Cupriavidus pauculus TaxID=82633 RepID=UPI001EE17BDF|nr:long-chain fatty acid--CoA ligase [Cupriavidus pauculus]GJG94048.1 AMP-dependent synthetase [Cupriavidus pauculus]
MNLGRFVSRSAHYWPDQSAIIFADRHITFAELDARSSRLANALLDLGLQKGDRVAVQSWNRPELIELETALYKSGLVKVALNARLSNDEVLETLRNAAPAVLISGPAHADRLHGLADAVPSVRHRILFGGTDPRFQDYERILSQASAATPDVELADSELAVLHYTSGSTGKLKAAMQTMGNRMASLRKVLTGRMRVNPGDVLALAGPITHASGMFMQPFLSQGGTILLHERFDPAAFLASVAAHRVTHTFVVPTMINMLLTVPDRARFDLSTLRSMTYGSAPMAPARIVEAWHAFGAILSQGYGAGETTGGLVALTIDDHREAIEQGRPERLASCGRAFSEAQVCLVDDAGQKVPAGEIGEIVIAGPDVFAGYWREPELTAAALRDGWLHTGDLARADDRGYLYIVDRKKDMIISGGFNVYPAEIETVLYQHPAVYEACVVGVPDPVWGESVKAVVVLRDGASAQADDLIQHCAERLADFKKPRSVDVVAELPKNANGKLSRKAVREVFWKDQERRVA